MVMKKKIRKHLISILIIAIIIVASFFPYSIHIEDALTLQAVPDFGIHISTWRILFEPILGLLLFFNRAFYAIEEIQFVLIWALLIIVVFTLIKFLIIKDNRAKKNYLIKQIKYIPVVIGLWFTVFVVILFIPLPNNTIVNNSSQSILIATHSHTEYSHDGLISQKNMWEWQKKNGFDAFFITDHANHKKTFEFVKKQRDGEFPIAPLVMVGEEYSASNHMSLLGLKNKFVTSGLSDQAVVDSVHSYGGVVIINHWFDGEKKSLDYYKGLGVEGFEIENSATEKYYNRNAYSRIKEYCENNGLIMNGGLDFHGYGNACTIWNAMDIPGWHKLDPNSKEEAILQVLQNGDQSKMKVLMYKDRPYYKNENLFFRPFITLFNYFRTLNKYQVLSWLVWIILFNFIRKISKKMKVSYDKIIYAIGIISALFLVLLGYFYYAKIESLIVYTELYVEYSTLLFYTGFFFLGYMLILIYLKFIKEKRVRNEKMG